MNLKDLISELERQKPLKWDKKVDSSKLKMVLINDTPRLRIGKTENYFITEPCHEQIAERLEIPLRYYKRMASQIPELLVENVNCWLELDNRSFFIRGLSDSVRAFLSERYRVIDHLDVLYCALNELQAHEAEIEDCYLSEKEMDIKIRSQKLKDFIRHRNDLVIGGLLITNSETGHKALRVEPRIFRVLCKNGMVMEDFVTRKIHLGDNLFDEEIYLSIRRSIKAIFQRFGEIVNVLRESTEIKVKSPQRVINNVVEHYRLTEKQKENILIAFGAEPEPDKYGIANAITRAAQFEDDWEKKIELEKIGGRVIGLSINEFKRFDEN